MFRQILACSALAVYTANTFADDDPFLWLEGVLDENALEWVEDQNQHTLERLTSHPAYDEVYADTLRDMTQSDRLPAPQIYGDYVYDLLQDEQHVRGVWQRTSVEDFTAGKDTWEAVLDIDDLVESEGVSWVFKTATCNAPKANRCILQLSPGGSDASHFREFDTVEKRFIEDGFVLPETKANFAWLDDDTVLAGAPLGPDSATTSGYARQVRYWKRGEIFLDAKVIFEVSEDKVWAQPLVLRDDDKVHAFVVGGQSIFVPEYFLLDDDLEPQKAFVPSGMMVAGIADGHAVGTTIAPFQNGDSEVAAGSLIAIPIDDITSPDVKATVVFTPDETQSVNSLLGTGVKVLDKDIFFSISEHVVGKIIRGRRVEGGWQPEEIPLPSNGAVSVVATHSDSQTAIVKYENPFTPPTLYAVHGDDAPVAFDSLAPRFDPNDFETLQYFATSKDGTRVPYFVTQPKGIELDGDNPTLIGAYGGFGLTITPVYTSFFAQGAPFKTMITHGGVYVTANIRGGSEYGPSWHQQGMLHSRQNIYDDFFAVAEDLIRRGYTSPRRLGITGASNSGLLTGVATTQRPDLYSAVLCGVPLLDMKRYHKLLAGASWMAEYGDPDKPEDWAVIKTYSPYQNVHKDRDYPEVFFYGSTKDDRVHPGHARKMAAKMQEQGHTVLFYEEMEGGHGAADLNLAAKIKTLQSVYLLERLFDRED